MPDGTEIDESQVPFTITHFYSADGQEVYVAKPRLGEVEPVSAYTPAKLIEAVEKVREEWTAAARRCGWTPPMERDQRGRKGATA